MWLISLTHSTVISQIWYRQMRKLVETTCCTVFHLRNTLNHSKDPSILFGKNSGKQQFLGWNSIDNKSERSILNVQRILTNKLTNLETWRYSAGRKSGKTENTQDSKPQKTFYKTHDDNIRTELKINPTAGQHERWSNTFFWFNVTMFQPWRDSDAVIWGLEVEENTSCSQMYSRWIIGAWIGFIYTHLYKYENST